MLREVQLPEVMGLERFTLHRQVGLCSPEVMGLERFSYQR